MMLRLCPLIAALIAVQVIGASAQQARFSSRVEAVRVDVLVTENGRPVRGLAADDFEIRDNGVSQKVELLIAEKMPLNLVLALDRSESVSGERLQHLKLAANALIGKLDAGDRLALLSFNHALTLQSPLTADVKRIHEAIEQISPGGSTALFDAVYTAIVLGESNVGRSLVIVFTDGADTSSYLRRRSVLDSARRTDVVVYGAVVAGVARARSVEDAGRKAGALVKVEPTLEGFVEDVAEQTGGNLVKIESTKDLREAFLRILEEFRNRYVLSFSPSNVEKNGWHRLEVRVKNRRVSVKARTGYQAGG